MMSDYRKIGRCLKAGGKLVGCTLLAEGTRRQQFLFSVGQRLGHAVPPRVADLHQWLSSAGIVGAVIEPARGLGVFHGTKRLS
jgi:hypothetical protein